MQYPRECLEQVHVRTWEEVRLWPMGLSLLPYPWALLTKISAYS